jgi:hypothetical protein
MPLLLKVLQLSLCSSVAGLARPVLMFLLGRVVVVVLLGRVVGIILLGRVVRIILFGRVVGMILLGRVVRIILLRWVVGIILLGRVVVLLGRVRVTSGCDRGEDEEKGHQQRRHKITLHHCRTLSGDLDQYSARGCCCRCVLSLWSRVRDGRGDLYPSPANRYMTRVCVLS